MSEPGYITPETQRRARPKWWVRALQALLVLALVVPVVYVAGAAVAPLPSATATETPPALTVGVEPEIDWPSTTVAAGYGVVGIEGAHGEDGQEGPVPMASLAKLITVLVVLDEHPLEAGDDGAQITLDATDVGFMQDAFDDAAPYFPARAGQSVTQRALVEWSLTFSSANASSTLARWAFGDVDAFLDAAAAWLADHGLDDTVIADPSGLDEASTSTAADLVQLGMLAVDDPVVLRAMGLEQVRVPGVGTVDTTNRVLGEAGVDGGKTGALFVWGRNLLLTADREIEGVDRRVVVVVLGAASEDDVDAAGLSLLESVWPNIGEQELVPAGTVVGSFDTPWGEAADAVTTTALSGTVWGSVELDVSVALDDYAAGTQPGDVGIASIEVAGETVETVVDASRRLQPPELSWRLGHPTTMLDWLVNGWA